jgi:hypothetical protein
MVIHKYCLRKLTHCIHVNGGTNKLTKPYTGLAKQKCRNENRNVWNMYIYNTSQTNWTWWCDEHIIGVPPKWKHQYGYILTSREADWGDRRALTLWRSDRRGQAIKINSVVRRDLYIVYRAALHMNVIYTSYTYTCVVADEYTNTYMAYVHGQIGCMVFMYGWCTP